MATIETPEEDADLLRLATVSKKHVFNRMLSWEFSQSAIHTKPSKCRNKSKKISQTEEEKQDEECAGLANLEDFGLAGEAGEESEGSEYFSAEEVFDSDSDDKSTCMNELNMENPTETMSAPTEALSVSSVSVVHSDRKRALSKRQKKRRKQNNSLNTDMALPFSQVEDFHFSYDEAVDNVQNFSIADVKKNVLSLSELCIRSLRLNKNYSQSVPCGLRQRVNEEIAKIKLEKLQLSWLLDTFTDFPSLTFMKADLPMFPSRNLWTWLVVENDHKQVSYLDYLPFTCQLSKSFVQSSFSYLLLSFTFTEDALRMGKVFSAFASMLELCLPSFLPLAREKKSRTEEESLLNEIFQANVQRLKMMCSKRFPELTKLVFDIALPYVFWSRGNFKLAAKCFLDLSKKYENEKESATFVYEVARLHLHFGDDEMAIKMIKEAGEVAERNLDPMTDEKKINAIDLQTYAIVADVHDQGLMTYEKSLNATSGWKVVLAIAEKHNDLHEFDINSFPALESMLCFHAGNVEDVNEWIQNMITKLETMPKSYTRVNFYLSLLYAWQGDAKKSARAFTALKNYGLWYQSETSQSSLDRGRQRDFTPWKNLVDYVHSRRVQIKPLKALWRTRLNAPRFTNTNETMIKCEADLGSHSVNLRLSKEENITGDMQMMLPPMRDVQLDPYTGKLQLPKNTSSTSVSQDLFSEMSSLIPTMIEVYKDNYGNKVTLLTSGCSLNKTSKLPFHMLVYTSACGKRRKINVVNKFHQYLYEIKMDEIKKYTDKDKEDIAMQVLRKLYNKKQRLSLEFDSVFCPIWSLECRIKTAQMKSKTDEIRQLVNQLKKKQKNISTKLISLWCGFSVQYGSCLVLDLRTEERENFLMMVNCSSIESFQEPCFIRDVKRLSMTMEKLFPATRYYTPPPPKRYCPHAEVIPIECGSSSTIYIYDKYGKEIDKINKEDMKENHEKDLHVVASKTFFISQGNMLAFHCNYDFEALAYNGPVKAMEGCGPLLVTITDTGHVTFVDGYTLLPLEIHIPDELKEVANNLHFTGEIIHFVVIFEKETIEESCRKRQAAIAVNDALLLITFSDGVDIESRELKLITFLKVPGYAKEMCILSESGLFVSATLHLPKNVNFYRETLFHYTMDGKLLGILPGLGPGPRSFFPKLWKVKDQDNVDKYQWHLYFCDGHGCIMCIQLV